MKRESLHAIDEALELSMAILELLADTSVVHTEALLARQLGASRTKIHRLLGILGRQGLVEASGRGGYVLGVSVAGLARRLLDSVGIIGHARPVLEELARKHGEQVYLAVLKGDEVIYVDGADGAQGEGAWGLVGKRFPSLSTSAGKACRAQQSRDLLEKTLRGRKRGSLRRHDLEARLVEFERIRARGIAIELRAETCSVATAVKDYTGKVVCALAVQGPAVRMLSERIEEEIAPSLMQGAATLSQKFGCVR